MAGPAGPPTTALIRADARAWMMLVASSVDNINLELVAAAAKHAL